MSLQTSGAGNSVLRYNRRLQERWGWVFWVALVSTPVVGYYFFKAIRIFFSEGLLGYRGAVFGDLDRPSILFDSNYMELLYTMKLVLLAYPPPVTTLPAGQATTAFPLVPAGTVTWFTTILVVPSEAKRHTA